MLGHKVKLAEAWHAVVRKAQLSMLLWSSTSLCIVLQQLPHLSKQSPDLRHMLCVYPMTAKSILHKFTC